MTTTTLFKKAEPTRRPPNLERQAIWFTVGLYLLISVALLAMHFSFPQHENGSSSGSPAHSSQSNE